MIRFVAQTGSTNADLIAQIANGEPPVEGEWLVARRQSTGRGRQGRDWVDGEGNFMGSCAVRIMERDPPSPTLALMAGLALYETVLPRLADPASLMLKWPNDLLLDGAKLAGILLETAREWVVIGIGVNLASAPELPDRKTIALSALGPVPRLEDFAGDLAKAFSTELERWRSFGTEPLIRRWLAAAHPIGARLRVHRSRDDTVTGEFAGLDKDGSLLLALLDGTSCIIHAGDVTLD